MTQVTLITADARKTSGRDFFNALYNRAAYDRDRYERAMAEMRAAKEGK